MIVGFPGETEEDFRALLDFVAEARFEHLGAFAGLKAAGHEHCPPAAVAEDCLAGRQATQHAVSSMRACSRAGYCDGNERDGE